MDSIHVFMIIGTVASFYSGLASFPGSIAIISNFPIPMNGAMNWKIPTILQEDDEINDELTNTNLTNQIRIQPHEAILVASNSVSAQPSDLRSLSLQNESGHPVFSLDIFKPKNTQSIDVKVDGIDGKVLRIEKDLDYSGDGEVDGEGGREEM